MVCAEEKVLAWVPTLRVNLTRYHGVFAPNSTLRSQITLSGRVKRAAATPQTTTERRQAMSWAQRLKRVFQLDIQQCECGGQLKLIACIEDPRVISTILKHLERQARGPPVTNRALTQ